MYRMALERGDHFDHEKYSFEILSDYNDNINKFFVIELVFLYL
jgi:hypothetical protein